ncbi:anti-sigma factor [Klenkia taihuensis]|uniref:Anti-sigma-K factor rskA n=1 Tax=Klenkia taihuensis TaxID=1225127 RepID=A0A1I1QXH0_9ACTN|nr:anti-sigma factor [Klenkia taihuensis]GHE07406.1 hypothetical protein GCM10011381_03510 [Klenkia taihuensis]SFD26796.1 Anti-sigma-K factor rskA [Klenkia taihuensis]
MQHCSPEDLALAALGEELPAEQADHLGGCADCTAEVTSLRRAVDALDTADLPVDDGPAIPVPDRVWAAIAAQTGVSTAPRPSAGPALIGLPSTSGTPDPAADTVPATRTLRSLPTPSAEGAPVPGEGADDARPPARRSPVRRWLVVGAVAAGLLVGVAVGAAVTRGGPGDPAPAPDPGSTVASARLDPFGDWDSTGEATLREVDGRWDLQLQMTAPPPPTADGFYEVWLLSADGGAQSLGTLQGDSGSYAVPDGVDLADFDVVDVSLEPYDGDPQHSTDSVARGTLG